MLVGRKSGLRAQPATPKSISINITMAELLLATLTGIGSNHLTKLLNYASGKWFSTSKLEDVAREIGEHIEQRHPNEIEGSFVAQSLISWFKSPDFKTLIENIRGQWIQ